MAKSPYRSNTPMKALLLIFSISIMLFIAKHYFIGTNEPAATDHHLEMKMMVKKLDELIQHQEKKDMSLSKERNKITPIELPVRPAPSHSIHTATFEWNSGFTSEKQTALYKAEATLQEMRNFLNSRPSSSSLEHSNLIKAVNAYSRTLNNDFNSLWERSGFEKWSLHRSRELGNLVQKRLHYIQNPINCETAPKVLCKLEQYGFGSGLQYLSACLIYAYATNRTLVVDTSKWRYTSEGWTSVFEPISRTCNATGQESAFILKHKMEHLDKYQVILIPKNAIAKSGLPYFHHGVPEDLAKEIASVNGNPPVWWLGQVLKYIYRPNAGLMSEIEKAASQMGFQSHIVGVHVRRTDKLRNEAEYHSLDEYMRKVEDHFTQLQRTTDVQVKRVYLITDDPQVYEEAKEYPSYTFISDPSSLETTSPEDRYTDMSLRLIIRDIYLLSRCDYIVCTFSSNVCRTAFALMQTVGADAHNKVASIDHVFYFFKGLKPRVIASAAYSSPIKHFRNKAQLFEMKEGDMIIQLENFWNGTSLGINNRTGVQGFFPTHKTVPFLNAVAMPTYPEIH